VGATEPRSKTYSRRALIKRAGAIGAAAAAAPALMTPHAEAAPPSSGTTTRTPRSHPSKRTYSKRS